MTVSKDLLASGDLIADRRYGYGRAAAGDGDFSAAADLFEQALERAPDWAAALFALGDARERLGRREAAAEAFRQALAADPSDALGAAARLALIGGTRGAGHPAPRLSDAAFRRLRAAFRGPPRRRARLSRSGAHHRSARGRRARPPLRPRARPRLRNRAHGAQCPGSRRPPRGRRPRAGDDRHGRGARRL